MDPLPELTLRTALSTWSPALLPDLLCCALLAVYGWGVHRHGGPWPLRRTLAWVGGVVLLVLATNSAIGVYGMTLYWMHMIKHLLLIMVVPALLVLGRPWTLLGGERVRANPVFAWLTRPVIGLAVYTVVLVGTHLTGFMPAAMAHPWLHDLEALLYLVGGFLLLTPLLGDEPIRYSLAYPQRLLVLIAGMVVDTVVGVVLMMANTDPVGLSGMMPRDWGPPPLTDLHWGGAIMWVIGDTLMLVLTLAVLSQWMRDPQRQNSLGTWLDTARARSLAEFTGRDSAEADDDAALDAYNAKLAALHRQSEQDRR